MANLQIIVIPCYWLCLTLSGNVPAVWLCCRSLTRVNVFCARQSFTAENCPPVGRAAGR